MRGEAQHFRQGALDPVTSVDRDRHRGQVLGHREQAVGLQPVALTESLDATEQNTRADLVTVVELEQGVGEQALTAAIAFAEVDGQLDPRFVHGDFGRVCSQMRIRATLKAGPGLTASACRPRAGRFSAWPSCGPRHADGLCDPGRQDTGGCNETKAYSLIADLIDRGHQRRHGADKGKPHRPDTRYCTPVSRKRPGSSV